MKDFRAIVAKFQIEDVFIEARPLGHGAINDTYEIICENDHYVLQEINRMVFKHPADVMNNLFAVTEHLKKKIEEEGNKAVMTERFFTKSDMKNQWGRSTFQKNYKKLIN